ncbi:hypothetical protein BDP81DRAFT_429036 [Colletotrichum phormii]|uniref:Uncharacterized protein n=1 Tax=Colletotrichum phormii TaxID=359342 RepID=A0AAJ0EGL9_9PEZI|nr:uncharacterized protein BDP81DRAFT_429036 [Colletotrichum phormii]KAK1636100.1 hypothetical protein BDP81DRAFT_429036 [Colletotrichum phormii]
MPKASILLDIDVTSSSSICNLDSRDCAKRATLFVSTESSKSALSMNSMSRASFDSGCVAAWTRSNLGRKTSSTESCILERDWRHCERIWPTDSKLPEKPSRMSGNAHVALKSSEPIRRDASSRRYRSCSKLYVSVPVNLLSRFKFNSKA